jgi:hypothetical protein
MAGQKKDWGAYNTYQDGKMKRYYLLFSINGGAYAIVTWAAEHPKGVEWAASPKTIAIVVAIAAALFTALMLVDVWLFGRMMKEAEAGTEDGIVYFGGHGKAVLASIVVILLGAWAALLALENLCLGSIPVIAGLVAAMWIAVSGKGSGVSPAKVNPP